MDLHVTKELVRKHPDLFAEFLIQELELAQKETRKRYKVITERIQTDDEWSVRFDINSYQDSKHECSSLEHLFDRAGMIIDQKINPERYEPSVT